MILFSSKLEVSLNTLSQLVGDNNHFNESIN